MRSNRGFTLVELMVVVAIVAIVSAMLMSVRTQTYGAGAANTAEQLVSALNLCKMRAVSTRRWHRCEVTPTSVTTMQWQNVGMAVPGVGVWTIVSTVTFGVGVTVWNASANVCAASPCTTSPSAANATLIFDVDFRPDGSSTGGTIFVADNGKIKTSRVVVYKATGSSYARNKW